MTMMKKKFLGNGDIYIHRYKAIMATSHKIYFSPFFSSCSTPSSLCVQLLLCALSVHKSYWVNLVHFIHLCRSARAEKFTFVAEALPHFTFIFEYIGEESMKKLIVSSK